MASSFQAQARNRKVLYIAIILVLFTGAWGWRKAVIEPRAEALALREESRGDVELLGSVVRLSLAGSRGLVTCVLWGTAFEQQKKNQWNALEVTVRALTRLQPHFITPWLFQSWNLSYNVSVEADRNRDKYFYITRGLELLARGERQNRHHPDLRWSIGFYTMSKLGRSDETNYHRSLLQLSMIPPNERDPARFWKRVTRKGRDGQEYEEVVFNDEELEKFCQDHPQLVRRLREGIHKKTERQKEQLFRCDTPQKVVDFLEENYSVPGLYATEPLAPARTRVWARSSPPPPLPELDRFPVLPPSPRSAERAGKRPFDESALSSASTLADHDDPFTVAHAWYAYAQEPLPEPDELPGHSKPIVNRSTQRRPRHMTTLIFRNYPAQGLRYHAERLQDEGWYDEDPWESDWALGGRTVKVGGGVKWSQRAWERAFDAWDTHGKENHLLFDSPQAEANTEKAAQAFYSRVGMPPRSLPPTLDTSQMAPQEKEEYEAAQFLFEYDFYRRVSNFAHHHNRCLVERRPETVATRKLFALAERQYLAGKPHAQVLAIYTDEITPERAVKDRTLEPLVAVDPEAPEGPGGKKKYLNLLRAWRFLVLARNKEFRRDPYIQEQTAEYQTNYLWVDNRVNGAALKANLVKVAPLLPLVPSLDPKLARPPVVAGPFDNIVDEDGKEYLTDEAVERVIERLGLPARRRPVQRAAPPGKGGKEGAPVRPAPGQGPKGGP
jgi:hypothetical protein